MTTEPQSCQTPSPAAVAAAAEASEVDPFIENYGDVPTEEMQSKAVPGRRWTEIGSLDAELADRTVLIRGAAQAIRPVGKKMAFLVVRQCMSTVQCVLVVNKECVSPQQGVAWPDQETDSPAPFETMSSLMQQDLWLCLGYVPIYVPSPGGSSPKWSRSGALRA